MCEYICIHICVHWSYMYNMTGGIVGWGDPPVGAYDMHGPNTDYGIIQPYHGILQPALIHIIAQCKYESKYEYKYKSTRKYKYKCKYI